MKGLRELFRIKDRSAFRTDLLEKASLSSDGGGIEAVRLDNYDK